MPFINERNLNYVLFVLTISLSRYIVHFLIVLTRENGEEGIKEVKKIKFWLLLFHTFLTSFTDNLGHE
jgi:hypothetical protein